MLQRIDNRDCKRGKTGECEYTWGTEVPDPFWAFSQKTVFKACLGTEVPVPSVPNTCMVRKDKVAQYLDIAERRIRCIIQ